MTEQLATLFRGDGGDLVVEPIRDGWLRIRIGGVGAEVRKCVALQMAEVIRKTAEGLEDTLG